MSVDNESNERHILVTVEIKKPKYVTTQKQQQNTATNEIEHKKNSKKLVYSSIFGCKEVCIWIGCEKGEVSYNFTSF